MMLKGVVLVTCSSLQGVLEEAKGDLAKYFCHLAKILQRHVAHLGSVLGMAWRFLALRTYQGLRKQRGFV